MDQNILAQLESAGLSNTEAKLYCALLALDEAPADALARSAGVNRTSCYDALERLVERNLASRLKRKGKTLFRAGAPEQLEAMLEERREQLERVMPELRNLFAVHEGTPVVRLYEGRAGLKAMLQRVLNEAKGEVLIFGDGDSFGRAIPGWTEAHAERRAARSLKARIILKGSASAIQSAKRKLAAGAKASDTKIRVLPEGHKIEHAGFDVFNQTVVLYSFDRQNVAVAVESRLISALMRTVFELLWIEAERYNDTLLK